MSVDVQFLSKTARYGIAAVTVLAELGDDERMSSADLAERTGVPRAFLGKVLTRLSREGLVDGVKGHGGGYRLARDPASLLLSEVVGAFSDVDGVRIMPCALGAVACDPENPCAVHDRWLAVRASLIGLLNAVSVSEAAAGRKIAGQGVV